MVNWENSNHPTGYIFQQREDQKGVLGRHSPADVGMYACNWYVLCMCVGECQFYMFDTQFGKAALTASHLAGAVPTRGLPHFPTVVPNGAVGTCPSFSRLSRPSTLTSDRDQPPVTLQRRYSALRQSYSMRCFNTGIFISDFPPAG